jgi:hypothetical protein
MSTPFEPFGRELSTSQIFSESFKLTRRFYSRVLPTFAVFGVVCALVNVGLASLGSRTSGIPANLTANNPAQLVSAETALASQLGLTIAEIALTLFILYLAAGVGVLILDGEWRGRQSANSWRLPATNFLTLAVTTAAVLGLVLLGSLLFLIPAFILGTMFYLSLVPASLEGRGTFAAMGRSRSLTSHRRAKTFAILSGTGLIAYIGSSFVGVLFSIPFTGELSTFVSAAAQSFSAALLFPLVSSSMLVLYYSSSLKDRPLKAPPSPYDDMKAQPMGGTAFPPPPLANTMIARFCSQCGAGAMPQEKYCHNCGRVLQPQ